MTIATNKSIAQRRKEINLTSDHGIRAVCFDLNGTLINTPLWNKLAFGLVMAEHGLPLVTHTDYEENFEGLRTLEKLSLLADREIIPRDRKLHGIMYEDKRKFFNDIAGRMCLPVDRIVATVERANLIFNDRTAVVTNCPYESAEKLLKASGLLYLFKHIITIEDFPGKPKPHPLPYVLAQGKLGAKGQKSVLAIEDTGRGIMSAIGAMYRTWWVKRFEDLTPENLVRVLDSYRITL